jgi:hypothetical protein
MAITSSNRTSATNRDTETIQKRQVAKELFHVGEPSAFPLITLLGGYSYVDGKSKPTDIAPKIKKESLGANKFEIIEKDPLARTVTTSAAVADTTTTTIVFASNSNIRQYDVLKNKATGEVVFVYVVDGGGANVTARRNLGSTAFQIGAGDVFTIMGNAFREGTAKADQKSQLAAARIRYLQIFKRSFGVTGTLDMSEQEVDVSAWDEERLQAAYNHKLDIETSCWGNPAADSTTDATGTVYMSRGILAEIGASRTSFYDGSLTEAYFFNSFAKDAFAYGGRRKALFVNADAMSAVTDFGRVKQQLKPMDTKYGLKITEIETGHGVFELTMCGAFESILPTAPGPYAACLDIDYVRFKSMEKRDMKMEIDIQTPGTDAREGQFFSECGFLLQSLPNHRILAKGI